MSLALSLFGAWAAQLLHALLILAVAPLLFGVVQTLRARLQGRRGPPVMQPWREIIKLLRKRPVVSETASAISLAAPYWATACTALALLLVPSFTHGMALAPDADLLVIAGLLAGARMAQWLAAMDAGSAFGGMGAARAFGAPVFAEPTLFLAILTFAILTGGTNLDAISAALQLGEAGLRVSLGLVLAALAAVALAGNGRLPVDNLGSERELGMGQEAMLLEASGRHLALWRFQRALLLLFWMALLAALFCPFGIAPAESAPWWWALGLLAFMAKLLFLAGVLAFFETGIARMHATRLPEFLGAALLLALLGAVVLFVSTRLA